MTRILPGLVLALGAGLLLAPGCSQGTAGDGPLDLTFSGDGCDYDGPSTLDAGAVTFEFTNHSDGAAAANMIKLQDGYTIEELIEYNGPQPSDRHAPYWSRDVHGVWAELSSGESHTWQGDLDAGTYYVVCVDLDPFGVWNGAGFEVAD